MEVLSETRLTKIDDLFCSVRAASGILSPHGAGFLMEKSRHNLWQLEAEDGWTALYVYGYEGVFLYDK